jgi:hypothetical protein
MKFTLRKFDGDDVYSWAVFRKKDLPKGHRGPVFYGQAQPVVCGCSRSEANYHKSILESK